MNRNAPLALLLALLLTLSACAGQADTAPDTDSPPAEDAADGVPEEETPEADAPFTLGYYSALGLNPYTCSNTTNQAVIRLLYEPLFEVGPDFSVSPVLARACTPDGTGRWTLTLSEEAVFWDGSPLTAQDVVYSLTQAAAEGSIYESRLAPMSDLSLEGDAVAFSWDGPHGELESLLEIPIVQSGSARDAVPVGTGPYQPVTDEDGLSALTVHAAWPEADALPLGEIALYPAPDSDMLIYHFERGAVTLVTSDLTAPDSLGYFGHYETWDYPTSHLLYLGCNTAEGPCAETAFRAALQSALNRETMAESLLSGHADASPLPFHPASALYDASLAEPYAAPDPSALEGWARTEVRLLVNADASFKVTLAEYAAATLADAGLTVTVQSLSWPAFQAALEAGEYDLYLGEVRLEPNFDLSCLLAEDGSLNFSGYRSEAVSSALEAYLASGAQGRADAAAALSLAVCRESPILPLCFERHSILSNWGGLKAYTATQSNLFYHFTQWDLGNRIS